MSRPTTGTAYLALILTILGGVTFTVFGTLPAYATWRSEELRLKENVERRAEKQTFLADIDARVMELQQLGRDAKVLQVMFPDTVASAELSALMHGLAARNGVVISRISELTQRKMNPETENVEQASAATGEGSGQAVPGNSSPAVENAAQSRESKREGTPYEFHVTFQGSYAQVRAFVADLERSLRFFDVPALEMTGAREAVEATGAVSAEVTLWTYLVRGQ